MQENRTQGNPQAQKVHDLFNTLKNGVQEVFESGRLQELARFWSRFHRYSFGNIMLIYIQRPDASLVAGFHTWLKQGRRVRKGERGIRILAPKVYTRKEVDDVTGEEITRTGLAGFKVVSVFDIGQTEGDPLPGENSLGHSLAGEELFKRLLEVSPVPVRIEPIPGSAKGYFDPQRQEIVVSSTLTGDTRTAVLMHELAHALAFSRGEQQKHSSRKDEAYIKGEVVAEGAAFIAAGYFGLNTGDLSFTYVGSWAKDIEFLLRWGDSVQRVARTLIELVEGNLAQKAVAS